jgi:prepilin-type N-terminal cleavage/methylation domain-containing protein
MQPPFSVRPNRRHCRGLTLVEVLIAIVLVTVGLLVTSDVIVAAETATKKGALDITATQVAENEIATDEAIGCDALNDGTATTNNIPTPYPDVKMTETVTYGPPGGVAEYDGDSIEQVDVVVSWTGSGPAELGGYLQMSTIVTDTANSGD